MDASLQIQGNIHDDKLIVQFVRLCPEYWVHIKLMGSAMLFSEWYKMLKGGLFSEIVKFASGDTYQERYESAMYSLLEFDDDIGSLMETIEDGDELLVKFNKFLTNGEGFAEAISKEFYKLFKGMSKDEAEWQVFLDGLDEYGDFASIRYFLEDYAVVSNVIDSIGGLELISDITCLYDAQVSVLYAMEDIFQNSETEYAVDAAKMIMARYEKDGVALVDSIDTIAKSLISKALDEAYEKSFNMEIIFSENPKLFLIQIAEEVVFDWIMNIDDMAEFLTLMPVYSDLQLDIEQYYYKHYHNNAMGAKLRGAGIMYLNAALHYIELLEFDKSMDLSSSKENMNKELAELLSYEESEYAPDYANADLIVIAEMGGNVTDEEHDSISVDATSNEAKSLLSVGDYVQFGNGFTWQVINIEDNIATLFFAGCFQGIFDASLHMESHTINLTRYHSYGSATWEYSDVRQWLNSRDLITNAVDVAFDYSNLSQGISAMGMSAIIRVESDQYAYSDRPGFLCPGYFNDKAYWLIEPTEITSIVPYTQIPGNVVSASSFENFNADMDVVYSEKVGQTKTIDRMFLLSGREIKEYLLDNGFSPYVFTSGKTYPTYWLRDSVYYDLAGYYFYYGTNILTVDGKSAGEQQADMSAGIRPACNINLTYVIGMSGEGTSDNPYKLDISDSVIGRTFDNDNNNIEDETIYYATSGGTYYHAIDNCNGMRNPSVITEAEAISIGKKACLDCIGNNTLDIAPSEETSIIQSGSCGNNVTYRLDEDGVLTISGSGEMQNYYFYVYDSAPWFGNGDLVTTVVIEEGVSTIGDFAFDSFNNLTNIIIPNSVTTIGEYAFKHCTSLTSITIPDSVTTIEDLAFANCSSLTSITIPDSVKSIGFTTFYYCNDNLTIYGTAGSYAETYANERGYAFEITTTISNEPQKVESTEDNTVIQIINYKSGDYEYILLEDGTAEITRYKGDSSKVDIPENMDGYEVTSIGDEAFFDFNSIPFALTEISIPDSVTSIGSNPFWACPKLTNIKVSPNHPTLATIDGVLFDKIEKKLVCYPRGFTAESYSIPQGVSSIGNSACSNCLSLTSISIPDSVTSIGDQAFAVCSSLTSINIPDSVTSIGDYAFSNCGALTEISIPDSVTSIGNSAFVRCGALTEISIPDSVTSVGSNPFSRCEKLTKIKVSPDHPTLATIDGVLFDKI